MESAIFADLAAGRVGILSRPRRDWVEHPGLRNDQAQLYFAMAQRCHITTYTCDGQSNK
jgi:hypothetical protein